MPAPRVAIHIPFISAYCRQVLRGIADFAHSEVPWRWVGNPVYARQLGEAPPLGDCDGVITHCIVTEDLSRYRAAGVPVVNVSGLNLESGVTRVCVDDRAIGKLGAEHLLDLGLHHLAYIQPADGPSFDQRRAGFEQRGAERDARCASADIPGRWDEGNWIDEDREHRLEKFLASQSRPFGLMTPHDALAVHAINTCEQLGFRVPDDVAVLGVGNDELFCDFANPALTSIDVSGRRIGYEAAKLLQAMMDGKAPSESVMRIPPHGVSPRESTEVVAVEDPMIADAVRYIRAHACRGINVADVVAEIDLSRRAFERRFVHHMKRTPLREIRRVQIEAAKFQLEESDDSIKEIAKRCGFRDAKYFSKAFRAETGMTPMAYRNDQWQGRRD